MKPVLTIGAVAVFGALAAACGAGSGPPEQQSQQGPAAGQPAGPPAGPPLVNATVVLTGTGVDSNETNAANTIPIATTIVTWKLTQTGANVSGTVTTLSTDPAAGHEFCNSCHRSRTGTLTGTISGATLTWTALFPADAANDPTPSCTATLSGTISDINGNSPSGSYSGQDTCEGLYANGTLTLAHQPGP